MAGYIGSKAVTLSTTAADVAGNAVIDGDLTVKGTTVTIDSAAVQEIRLGDNDKMTFGDATGGDLQIYHDGNHSYISDQGTGRLYLQASNDLFITNADGTENKAIFTTNGESKFFYDGAAKLATTSTGIDVTGNVTADGLTVDGFSYLSGMQVRDSSNAARGYVQGDADGLLLATDGARNITFDTNATERMRIDSSGRVAIGDTPKASFTGHSILQVGRQAILGANYTLSSTGQTYLTHNIYYDTSGTPQVFNTSTANEGTVYTQFDGVHKWSNSAATTGTPTVQERMRIDSSGNVGIGTSFPSAKAHIKTASEALRLETTDTTGDNYIRFDDPSGAKAYFGYVASATDNFHIQNQENSDIILFTNASERMRIDSSGNLLVSATTTSGFQSSSSESGTIAYAAGGIASNSPSNDVAGVFNRLGTDGIIVQLKKDGTTVGSIGVVASNNLYVHGDNIGLGIGDDNLYATNASGASNDNAVDLGDPSVRWDDVYATNGTIQTSDQNEKQQIASLTDAEITAAKEISKLFKTFKWNDSVAEKGDAARTHSGVIAQEVEQAMTDAGLNAGDYAFFISTTWWETQTEVPAVEAVEAQDAVYEDVIIPAVEEVLDEEGNVVTEAQPERTEQRLVSEAVEAVEAQEAYTRTDTYHTAEEAPEGATERNRKGIRYPELLSFIGAATEQRLASIESRLDALEGN